MKFLFLVFFIFGCGVKIENKSNTDVVNGVYTSNYRAVVSLKLFKENGSRSLCTGTFIKPDLILTAAHCVNEVVGVEALGHRSTKIIKNKYYDSTFEGLSQDFALVKFRDAISMFTMKVSKKELIDRQSIILIGYGVNNYRPYRSGAGTKRLGFNTYRVNDYLERGIVQFEGHQRTQSENGTYHFASVGQGDSGGPLIASGRIVGVASAQALYNDVNSSYYSYTVGENFKDFMFRASKVLEL